MTINMLFFTIVIKKKGLSREEAFHQETIKQWHEKSKDNGLQIRNIM